MTLEEANRILENEKKRPRHQYPSREVANARGVVLREAEQKADEWLNRTLNHSGKGNG